MFKYPEILAIVSNVEIDQSYFESGYSYTDRSFCEVIEEGKLRVFSSEVLLSKLGLWVALFDYMFDLFYSEER